MAVALAVVLAWGAFDPSVARAQAVTTGEIGGSVADSAGKPLPGVDVSFTHSATGWTRTVLTESTGKYRSPPLPPGSYEVRAEKLGYRPLVVMDVTVSPTSGVALELHLMAAEPPVAQVDTLTFVEGALHASLARGTWDPGRDLVDLVDPLGRVSSVAALASVSTGGLGMQGLPDRMGFVGLDGIPSAVATNPAASRTDFSTLGLPLVSLDHAELGPGTDVEWQGYGGGLVSAFGVGAPREGQVRAYGDASGGSLRGGLVLGGPVVRDTAFGLIGIDARRLETPLAAPWPSDSTSNRVATFAHDSLHTDLSSYLRPVTQRTDVITAFGRFDWQIVSGQSVALRAAVTNSSSSDFDLGTGRSVGLGSGMSARDISGSLAFNSRWGSRLRAQFSLAINRSQRIYDAPSLPGIVVVSDGLSAGADGALPGRFERNATQASGALLYRFGAHELKAGLIETWTNHDITYDPWRSGTFVFGSAGDFALGRGSYIESLNGVPAAAFSINSTAFFGQDSWSPTPGLGLLLGVRIESERWPTGGVAADAQWRTLTGLSNAAVPRLKAQVSPRFAFTWSAGPQREWLLRGEAGIFAESVDPSVLAEVLSHDGSAEFRRGLGSLGRWPDAPDNTAAPVTGPVLTLLNSGFQAPRTGRADIGIARELRKGVSLEVEGQYRHTDFLPRRSDLNLSSSTQWTDQYGRPVYGTLQQFGGMLAATPGSNRSFSGFDRVWALDPSGFSDYWGVTVALESLNEHGLSLWASYTYSRTTDNVPGLFGTLPDAQLSPFPANSQWGGWRNGVSDLDVPHRATIGAQMVFGGLRVEGLVRYRSGLPFTPGFRDGVDANGDGAAGNDPAFVSDTVSGAAALLGSWSCLRGQIGQFAARNSCRGPAVTSLDLRLAVHLFTAFGAPAELVVDGLNLLTTNDGIVDRALYLVDPSRALSSNAATGVVTVPLVANPNFGKLLYRRSPAAGVRAGLRLAF